MIREQPSRDRVVVVVVPESLERRLHGAAPDRQDVGALVTDAITRLDAVLATSRPVDAVAPSGEMVMLEVRVPWWAADLLDRAVGARPGLDDRSSTLAVALAAHLDAVEPAEPGRGVGAHDTASEEVRRPSRTMFDPASSTPFAPRTLDRRQANEQRDVSLDWASRAERSLRRLHTLVGADFGTHFDVRALFPPDPPDVWDVTPAQVGVGLDPAELEDALLPLPEQASGRGGPALSGLTNRVAPSLWAASQLARMQMAVGGRPVRYHEFLVHLMPAAWAIGEGLARAERFSDRAPFSPSARWPKESRGTSIDREDLEPGDRRTQKLAQAATSFIEYSLLAFPGTSRGRGREVGPMAALGLAALWPDRDDLWVAANPSAVHLLVRLHELGTSCLYPHPYEAWEAYEAFLMSNARCSEAMDQLHLLDILASSTSRTDFYEKASTFKLSAKQLERLQERAKEGKSTKGYSTEANGFIGRLREWGLVVMDPGAYGPDALTAGGREALDRFRPSLPGDQA